MTSSEAVHENYTISCRPFAEEAVKSLVATDTRLTNWPVVYILSSPKKVYVGETLDYDKRMRQHLDNSQKRNLRLTHVILHEKFSKSACLDLESTLINLFTGDGQRKVLNANNGIVDADYYLREQYRRIFEDIFESLRNTHGLFSQSKYEIENSDLYKYSPFKQLNEEQEATVTSISEGIIERLKQNRSDLQEIVIEGGAGTGKTILAVYLMKLIADYASGYNISSDEDPLSSDNLEVPIATNRHRLNIGLVIPQASLRDTIKKVFKSVDGLSVDMLLSPFDIPKILIEKNTKFDLLIIDEAHRLNRFSAQANGKLLNDFRDYNRALYPEDDPAGNCHDQLDWARHCSKNLILLLDKGQAVRPADLSEDRWDDAIASAKRNMLHFPLTSQMRMQINEIQRYKRLIRTVFSEKPITPELVPNFEGYDFRIFTDFQEMRAALKRREEEFGLSRTIAGYAWPWVSKGSNSMAAPYDIELDGVGMHWNRTTNSWAHSPNAFYEVGSIHTIQGYDLNYAGVIIGPDVEIDSSGKYRVNRDHYHDRRGKANNTLANEITTDEQLAKYVAQIYEVLLTRGILGTYVYAESSGLAERLHQVQRILEQRHRAASESH